MRASSWVWGRKIVCDGADFLGEVSEETFGRSSESNFEGRGDELFLPRMVLKF